MTRWLPALLLLAGCFPDDWNGQPYQPGLGGGTDGGTWVTETDVGGGDTGDTTVPVDRGIVGSWVSEGSHLSDLFAGEPFNYVLVEARFKSDGSYVVTSEDDGGTSYVLTGTYTTTDGQPGTIALVQSEPYVAEASGIWQVDGDQLRYEVVQTLPDYGFAPPTPEKGFGSTSGPGMTAGVNVQVYVRD
ncbi:MAG: hypothetical protein H6738_03615 [Alphaproteobacteria bacterium]|nr:hypothetical protein [Alphaproteobacteria bacterium]MCB9695856.1 hypothetical protein [Alphaproteobacteria bacterium]